jgi:hypothetical protein
MWDGTAWVNLSNASVAGTVEVFDLLNSKKAVVDTPDDEFEAETLDAQWTAVTGTLGTVDLFETGEVEKFDLTTRPGWMLMQAGSAADQKVELRQDWTLGDGESIVVAIAWAWATSDGETGITTNEQRLGIGLNDTDSGHDAGAYIYLAADVDVDSSRLLLYDGSTALASTKSTTDDSVAIAGGELTFLRISRIGTTYRGSISNDGMAWQPFGSKTIGTAPTNLWLFCESPSASQDPVPIHAVYWVRQGTNALDPWNPNAAVILNDVKGTSNITPVGTDTNSDTIDPTLTWPAGVADGDYAFTFHSMRNQTTTGPDAGSGWTNSFREDTASNEWVEVWYRECDGTETGTITFTNASTLNSVAMCLLRGVDVDNPFTATGSVNDPVRSKFGASIQASKTGYSLYWFANVYNGTTTPSITSSRPDYPLTTILINDGETNDHQVVVAGRDSGTNVSWDEEPDGWGQTSYLASGIFNLNSL